MTTIFISKMEGLPPTSDIKMIDIWLILCQMVPFAEVVLLTGMEYYRRDANHEEMSKKNLYKKVERTPASTEPVRREQQRQDWTRTILSFLFTFSKI